MVSSSLCVGEGEIFFKSIRKPLLIQKPLVKCSFISSAELVLGQPAFFLLVALCWVNLTVMASEQTLIPHHPKDSAHFSYVIKVPSHSDLQPVFRETFCKYRSDWSYRFVRTISPLMHSYQATEFMVAISFYWLFLVNNCLTIANERSEIE